MKRMHLHVSVDNLEQSISFYNILFGAAPSVQKADYAKWMLDDPLVNFAISKRGAKAGLDHVGIQVETDEELAEIKARFDAAELSAITQEDTTCCYAKSDKHWVQDPSGLAWETYRTLASAPTFSGQMVSDEQVMAENQGACCAPKVEKVQFVSRKAKGGC